MGQVAFDTQEFVETLESAGLPKDQAKAISIAVRKSHEVADVATKRDLEDVRKDLTIQIADVRKDMDAHFEKLETQMQTRFEKTDAQIADARKETATQIALLRKDVESISTWLLIKMAAMMTALLGVAVTLVKILI